MALLSELPTLVIDLIAHFLDSYKHDPFEREHVEEREFLFRIADKDVVALSSTCKALSEALLSNVFHCIILGKALHQDGYKQKLEWLAENGRKVLSCVRVLMIAHFSEDALKPACDCIRQMDGLVQVDDYCRTLPSSLADALSAIPSFTRYMHLMGGVESLPRILPFARQLTALAISTAVSPLPFDDDWTFNPPTVAYARRSKLPPGLDNVPTPSEQTAAAVEGLAQVLVAAKDNLTYLRITGDCMYPNSRRGAVHAESASWLDRLFKRAKELNGGEYPVFPQLQRLCIVYAHYRCSGYTHRLLTSKKLEHLEMVMVEGAKLPIIKAALPRLKTFYILPDDNIAIPAFVHQISEGSPLTSLHINGLEEKQLPALFGAGFTCGLNLRHLVIDGCGHAPFYKRYISLIADKCPNLYRTDLICAGWICEAVDIFEALHPLKQLRYISFDHPREKPRGFAFPMSDGRTIRSDKHGDFRVLSVMEPGRSINEEIRCRIRADIDAVTPVYHKRFASIAKAHPSLRGVQHHITDEVTWVWEFVRDGDLDTGKLVKLKHHPTIKVEVGGRGDSVPSVAGVFMRMQI